MKISEKQKRFAEAYLELGNCKDAAERAGYRRSYASELHRTPVVQAYLKARIAGLDGDRMASANEVLAYLTRVMRGKEGGGAQASMKAAELLGKRMGLFAEQPPEMVAPVIVDDVAGLGTDECAG